MNFILDYEHNKIVFKSEKGFSHILILAGLAVIAVVAVAGYFLFMVKPSETLAPVKETAAVQTPPLTLSIDSPSDGTVVTDKKITIKGTTLPNTAVIMFTESDQTSLDSDAQGNFEDSLMLDDGINSITITAYDDKGGEKSTQFDVVSDTAK